MARINIDVTDDERRAVVATFRSLRERGFYRRLNDSDAAALFKKMALLAGARLLDEEGPG